MKPIVKKAISLFLVLIFTFSGISAISANAVTANEILNKLAILDDNGSTWGSYGNLKPGSSFTNGQCWQYVKGISSYVYGTTVSIPNTASYLGGGSLGEYYRVSAALTNCSYEQIVSLLKTSQPGDIIGFKNSKVDATYGHIMFIGNVTNQKITFYQAASGYARKDTVDLTVAGLKGLYSFGYSGNASFASSSYGISLFRCNRRTGVDDWSTTPTDTSKPEITVNVGTSTTNTTITLSKKNTSASRHDLHIYYTDGRTYLTDSFDNTYSYSVKLPEGTFTFCVVAVVDGNLIWGESKKYTIPKGRYSLTVNYYSNYADKSFDSPETAVSASSNVLVRTAQFDYSTVEQYGVHDYSHVGDGTYLGRTGYMATGYWNTKADGSGYRIYEDERNITGSQIAQKLGLSIANGNATVNLYPEWKLNKLTVNYYSNYANQSFDNPQNTVSASSNVLVRTAQFDYSTVEQYGVHDYSHEGDSTYLGRTGYMATGYWNTKADGSGYRIYEDERNITGSQIAQKLGLSIANGNATVNLYPEWTAPTYTFNHDPNGGTIRINPTITVKFGEEFQTRNTTCTRTGYTFSGWCARRNSDNAWAVAGKGWLSESTIREKGYQKQIYSNNRTLKLDYSWTDGLQSDISFSFVAQWTENTYTVNFTHWCYGFNGKGTNNGNDSNAVRLTTTARTFPYTSGIAVTTDDCINSAALPNGVECINTFSSSTFSESWDDYSFPQTFNNVETNPLIQINYQLIDYSITYDLDGGTLAEPNPATYNVVFGASFANEPTKPGYTFAGWTVNGEIVTGVNETELDDSVFVNDAGLAGGAFYEAVKNRTTGNLTVKAKWIANPPVVNPTAGSGAVVNESTRLIYGLTAGGTAATFEQNYVTVSGGSLVYEYPTEKQVMGTGTKVKVYDIEQALVDSYTVVVFGDIDGDGWYDGTDAYFVGLVANGLISQSALTAAQLAACDANHDGAIDAADAALLEQAGLLLANVDQTMQQEELQTDSVYLEYCSLIDQSITITEPEQPAADQPAQTAEQPAAQSVWGWIKALFTIVLNWLLRVF